MIDFYQAELDIISPEKNTSKLEVFKAEIKKYKSQIEYNCDRFIEQYGSKIDKELPGNFKYHKFIKIQNEEYAKITRIESLLNAYRK